MSKKFEERLAAVTTNIATLRGVAQAQQVDFDEYRKARMILNTSIIEVVFGATITGDKIKFNRPLPDIQELSLLISTFNEFYSTIEVPLMAAFASAAAGNDPESDDIPVISNMGDIPTFTKIHVKDVKDAILGGSGYSFPMISMMFSPVQILEMAGLSENLRKVIRRNQIIIIAGITVAVAAAATVAGVCVYNHNKHKDDEQDDVEDVGGPEDDGYDESDDVPRVELDIA